MGGWFLLVSSGLVRMEHGEEPEGLLGGTFHNPIDCLPPDSSLNGILIQPNSRTRVTWKLGKVQLPKDLPHPGWDLGICV